MEIKMADALQLAIRVARRYGKRTSFGKWEKVIKGGHIPLTLFNSRKVESVANRAMKISSKVSQNTYNNMFKEALFQVSELLPTQPFVRTNDIEILTKKINEHNPVHIRVVTHKGLHYIDDGHHAVMAARMRGDKEIKVSHLDLDSFPYK